MMTSSAIYKRPRPTAAFNDEVASALHAKNVRRVYDVAFKMRVVEYALKLPHDARIKPTCRAHPGVEPVGALLF